MTPNPVPSREHRAHIELCVNAGIAVETLIRSTGVWIDAEVKPLPFNLDWDNYDYRVPEPRPVPSIPSREAVDTLREVLRQQGQCDEDGVLRQQGQCDEDGVMCIVSRQAVDEAIDSLRDLLAEVERMRKNWASSQWTYDEANSFLRANDELRAEVERLTKQIERVHNNYANMSLYPPTEEIISLRATVAQQAEALAAAQKDAERYRWLRSMPSCVWRELRPSELDSVELDAAIDAALAQSASQPKEKTSG